MRKRYFIKTLFSLSLLLSPLIAFSEQYYFDAQKEISLPGTTNKFVKTVSQEDGLNDPFVFWQEIEESTNEIYLSALTKTKDSWSIKSKIAGPFHYTEDIPDLFTVAANKKGTVITAVLSDTGKITLFTWDKDLNLKNEYTFKQENTGFLGPRIYKNSKDGFTLFVSLAEKDSFQIFYTKSSDGKSWSELEPFEPAFNISNASNPIVPVLIPFNGKDCVVFQAQYTYSNLISMQFYITFEADKNNGWSKASLLTDAKSVEKDRNFYSFSNQNITLLAENGKMYAAWERSPFNTNNTDIVHAEIDKNGKLLNIPEKISTSAYSSKPKLFSYRKSINLIWFTTVANKKNIYLAQKNGLWWEEPEIIAEDNAIFPAIAIFNKKEDLTFFWEEANSHALISLDTDHYTAPPILNAASFEPGKKYNTQKARAQVLTTSDSSGIKGYSWLWTQDASKEPEKKVMRLTEDTFIDGIAAKDGIWYFKARQADYAENWSETVSIPYIFDSTPPKVVTIDDIEQDAMGLAVSNTLAFTWKPDSKDTDIAGYTYTLEFIDSIPHEMATNRRHPTKLSDSEIAELVKELYDQNIENLDKDALCPKYIVTESPEAKFYNIKNGLYIFTVCAIDDVGNISNPQTKEFVFNKYNPVTYISQIKSEINKYGDTAIDILGGGFTYDGRITEIYIDKDGFAPYDVTLKAENNEFSVMSDGTITDIHLKNLNSNSYKIGLLHTDRGLYFTKDNILQIEEFGTVKQKLQYIFQPAWKAVKESAKKNINIVTIVLLILILFAVIGIAGSLKNISEAAKETVNIKLEVKALLEGDTMPQERKHKSELYKNRGLGLKAKLILHSTILISVMDILIFAIFGIFMTKTQESTLTESLNERVSVMLDSIVSGSKIYLPQTTGQDNLSLTDIASQTSALNETIWTTIIGNPESADSTDLNAVWATTDQNITEKIDTEFLQPGTSRLLLNDIAVITEQTYALNKTCAENAHDISINISELTREALSLISKTDEKSIARRQEIQSIRNQLTNRLDLILSDIAQSGSGIIPEFTKENINSGTKEFIFYKPIIYRQGSDQNFVHGIVLMNISTESLSQILIRQRRGIIISAIIILLIVVALSFISTYVIASSFIKPINKIVKHVEMIRDTEDKENLQGKDIEINSKDELGVLGDTVNDMTHGLVQAAIQSKNLVFGKEVQTKFIPLQTDENGNTLTTGSLDAGGAEFFSYYAGADDLSGDYFDYKRLDKNHYAIIKCDVSGHGVPAALIMVEVATLFLNYFDRWDMNNPEQGYNLAPVVGQINDLLESRGFKGRFAAFTLCILNVETGVCHFCNAGDNIIHVFDNRTKKKRTVLLQETPAAGMFSTDLIQMKGGYQVSEIKLKQNDVLLLYTDGIEEAKRNFRDNELNLISCDEPGIEDGKDHKTHAKGDSSEEMTSKRVGEIIEAVYTNKKYILHKWHHPDDQNDLVFDFTNSPATAEEAIMALVSVEKVFRMYKPSEIKITDKVKCDKKIDAYLKQHFEQYSSFCFDKTQIETDPSHVYYRGVLEDPQYDDLTLIAIKKN